MRRRPATLSAMFSYWRGKLSRPRQSRTGSPQPIRARSMILGARDADALVVQIRAVALVGGEQLVADRIEHASRGKFAVLLQGQRDRPVRHGVQEVAGTVQRVDDEPVLGEAPFAEPALLGQDRKVRPGLAQLLDEHLLGPPVGGRDEVGRPLHRPLQLLDLAEIAGECAGRLHDGTDHDFQVGRTAGQGRSRAFMGRRTKLTA